MASAAAAAAAADDDDDVGTCWLGFETLPSPLRFSRPLRVLCARRLEDVCGVVAAAEAAALAGAHVVGLLAYESAPAFDPALRVPSAPLLAGFPLAWFGVYAAAAAAPAPPPEGGGGGTHVVGRDAVGPEELGGVANVSLVAVVGVPAAARNEHGPVALQRVCGARGRKHAGVGLWAWCGEKNGGCVVVNAQEKNAKRK